jgi:hypothetical protein
MLELMTLVETGTRALIGAVFGPTATGEVAYASRLLPLLRPDMLVLWDKGFDSNAFLAAVHATGARFLGRMNAGRRPPVLARLADGSYLSQAGGLPVRIIEATITVTCADGTVFSGAYRLATTLTDAGRHPAAVLIALYHQRWEHESAYFALRHSIVGGRVLRSGDPVGVEQEMWALLAVYQVLRTVMVDAVEQVPGTDPDRAGFTTALQAARDQLITAEAVVPQDPGRLGTIGRKVLAGLLPARRLRVSARKVKASHSRYHYYRPDGRPRTSQTVTALDIEVCEPPVIDRPQAAPAAPPKPTRRDQVLDLMRDHPERPWPGAEIAQRLCVANASAMRSQLVRWARQGLLHKLGRNIYTLP